MPRVYRRHDGEIVALLLHGRGNGLGKPLSGQLATDVIHWRLARISSPTPGAPFWASTKWNCPNPEPLDTPNSGMPFLANAALSFPRQLGWAGASAKAGMAPVTTIAVTVAITVSRARNRRMT